MDKIAALNGILELDSTNAFARYGLAMEHAAQGNSAAALDAFALLIEQHPDYVPAYQLSAQILIKLTRFDEARARLDAGLAAAQRSGNSHAASEMQAMRDDLD